MLILVSILVIPSLLFGGQLQEAALKIADRDSTYVIEKTNNNDLPRIDVYCRNVGIPLRSPYCAAGLYTWYREGAEKSNNKNPMYRTGSTGELYRNALKNPMRFKFIKASLVKSGSEKLERGDVVLWSANHQFTRGHTGIVKEQVSNTTFTTIEANTTGSNLADEQREQTSKSKNKGGVKHKKRSISDSPSFQTRGFIRERSNGNQN